MSKIFTYVPSAYKVGKTYTAIPNDGTADFGFTRPATADRIDENGDIETMAIDVPRIDYSDDGCPVLLLSEADTERCFMNTPDGLDINPNEMVWSVELAANSDSGTDRMVSMHDLTNSLVTIGYTSTNGQTNVSFIDNGVYTDLTYDNSDVTILKEIKAAKKDNEVYLVIDNVLVDYSDVATEILNLTNIDYSFATVSSYMDGKTRNNTVDNDISTLFPDSTSREDSLNNTLNSYTLR